MSFRTLRGLDHPPSNSTADPGITQLPATILDAFLPGYSFIARYVLDVFGFDISILVSLLVLGLASTAGLRYIYRHLWDSVVAYFSASVMIDSYDAIHDYVISWAGEQRELKSVRWLGVQSADYTDDVDELTASDQWDEGVIFNFNNWVAQIPPRYEPAEGNYWFRHQGHWFKFSRERIPVDGRWLGMMPRNQQRIQITVLGRSTKPIKNLILEARDRYLSKKTATTTVRRPCSKEQRGFGWDAWNKVAVRPSRPMDTVVLDNEQKTSILMDINDFMKPATRRWYSSRGIPYRRGYLLTGPPGTGKTSLCFALAGVFGLDIYCISLSEKNLSEEDLILLFNSLPRRCLVLLEDIDSAGMAREGNSNLQKRETDGVGNETREQEERNGLQEQQDPKTAETTVMTMAMEVAKAVRTASRPLDILRDDDRASMNNSSVSVSGLLNALDGVASRDGRLVILTTNYPERLDLALTRPGRVDMTVAFGLASKRQIRELFVRMYSTDSTDSACMPTNLREILPNMLPVERPAARLSEQKDEKTGKEQLAAPTLPSSPFLPTGRQSISPTGPVAPGQDDTGPRPSSSDASSEFASVGPMFDSPLSARFLSRPHPTSSELQDLADGFAGILPDQTFSPAELQGFMLMRKNDPQRALREAAAWRDGEIARKKRQGGKTEQVSEERVNGKKTESKETDEGGKLRKTQERIHESKSTGSNIGHLRSDDRGTSHDDEINGFAHEEGIH